MKKMRAEFKQLSFETAIRNPERYKEILDFVNRYDNVVLDDKNLLEIVSNMYVNGIVKSSEFIINESTTQENINDMVVRINKTRKADGGFPSGYQSRFWTYMRTLSEFGFVYARYNKKLKIGDVSKRLLSDEIDEQEAFSIQAMKYNRKSPYRNVSNDINYFRFIIKVLKKLKERNKKLSYNQFIVSLFNQDGDVDEFLYLLDNNKFGDKQKTFEFLKNNYPKTNKIGTVMQDYPDVVLRLLRITGFVSIEYKGVVLIELNSSNEKYIDELLNLNFILNSEEKTNAKMYFNKLEVVSEKELSIIKKNKSESEVIKNYNCVLTNIIESYNLDENSIIKNINGISYGNEKVDERFKYIPDPLKLEFFISLFMYFIYGKDFTIKPNYKVDSNGMPISHAPGNIGDIEINNKSNYWLLEVTLIRNKMQQQNNETVNLFRHIDAKNQQHKYLSLIAPYIHDDTERLFQSATIGQIMIDGIHNFSAKPYNIKEFLNISQGKNNFEDMNNYTETIIDNLKTLMID